MPADVPTIKKSIDFKRIYEKGKKNLSESVTIFFMPARELRIGISISKKQGKAVQRNRARRLIKEFFRRNKEKIKPADIIIVARAPLFSKYSEAETTMLKLVEKVGLIK